MKTETSFRSPAEADRFRAVFPYLRPGATVYARGPGAEGFEIERTVFDISPEGLTVVPGPIADYTEGEAFFDANGVSSDPGADTYYLVTNSAAILPGDPPADIVAIVRETEPNVPFLPAPAGGLLSLADLLSLAPRFVGSDGEYTAFVGGSLVTVEDFKGYADIDGIGYISFPYGSFTAVRG
jgi:hypothetical protein